MIDGSSQQATVRKGSTVIYEGREHTVLAVKTGERSATTLARMPKGTPVKYTKVKLRFGRLQRFVSLDKCWIVEPS